MKRNTPFSFLCLLSLGITSCDSPNIGGSSHTIAAYSLQQFCTVYEASTNNEFFSLVMPDFDLLPSPSITYRLTYRDASSSLCEWDITYGNRVIPMEIYVSGIFYDSSYREVYSMVARVTPQRLTSNTATEDDFNHVPFEQLNSPLSFSETGDGNGTQGSSRAEDNSLTYAAYGAASDRITVTFTGADHTDIDDYAQDIRAYVTTIEHRYAVLDDGSSRYVSLEG